MSSSQSKKTKQKNNNNNNQTDLRNWGNLKTRYEVI